MSWPLYLALRQLFPAGRRVSFFTLISIVGVALGVALPVVVLSVMGGFGQIVREKITQSDGDIRVSHADILREPRPVLEKLRSFPGVRAAAPYAEGMVMMQYENRPTFPFIRGIQVEEERHIVPFDRFVVRGSVEDLDDDSVLLSSGVARALGAQLGESVEVYSPLLLERLKKDAVLLPRSLRVVGIYETGWNAVDANTVICSLRLMQDLYGLGEAIHGFSLRLDPGLDAEAAARSLDAVLPARMRAQSWIERNYDFQFALKMEKTLMFFILLVVLLVSAFAITSSLWITVVRKTREIGVLGAMGGDERQVAACYCWQGLVIGLAGTLLGLALGLLLLHFRNELVHPILSIAGGGGVLGSVYGFANLPVTYDAGDFAAVSACSVVFCTLAGAIPAWRAARLRPAEALRSE